MPTSNSDAAAADAEATFCVQDRREQHTHVHQKKIDQATQVDADRYKKTRAIVDFVYSKDISAELRGGGGDQHNKLRAAHVRSLRC